jgi:hypothetical protein
MPLTVRCPGCGSNLSAPDHLAGQAVRCTKCRQPMNLPTVLDAQPVAPRPLPVAAPPKPLKRAAIADDRPARRPEPRRRKGFPVVPVVVVGGLLLLVVGGVGVAVAVVTGLFDRSAGGGLLGPTWTRETVPGTDFSVELPGKTNKATTSVGDQKWQGNLGAVFGETSDPLGGRVVFMASVMGMTDMGGKAGFQFPGGWDFTEMAAMTAQHAPDQRLIRRYEIQGRKAALIGTRQKDGDGVLLYVSDGGRTIPLQAIGKGIDENHPDVKRFIDSARFAR